MKKLLLLSLFASLPALSEDIELATGMALEKCSKNSGATVCTQPPYIVSNVKISLTPADSDNDYMSYTGTWRWEIEDEGVRYINQINVTKFVQRATQESNYHIHGIIWRYGPSGDWSAPDEVETTIQVDSLADLKPTDLRGVFYSKGSKGFRPVLSIGPKF